MTGEIEIFQIKLEDKTGTIQSLSDASKRQIKGQCPVNTFKYLFLSEEKHCLNFEEFIKRCTEFSPKILSLLGLSSGKGILFTPGLYLVFC